MRDEDAELCRAAREGDHDAASQLVSRHYKRIYAYFARLAPPDDAEDLTQRTFSKVWEALASFSGKSSFSTWVHGIAHHVYVDWRRKRNLLDPQPLEWWDSCSAETPSPFESAAERDEVLCLYRWVDQLDADSRE
ncbi:MAG TPA: RNA polymerase sigma factor, partial [Methylomirabilota bacterium]|nr:RNA polymerase sigma factor [Methylomirabilota bacterium]